LGRAPPAGTDDAAFLLALVDRFVASGVADPKRIYVTGISNGGAMTMSLACRHGERFAAAASVIMSLTPGMAAACMPAPRLPMLLMNGTADPLIPYDGGRGLIGRGGTPYWASPDTLAFWRRANGCEPGDGTIEALPDRDMQDGSTVTRIGSHCPAGTDVQLVRIDGGGHRMPGRDEDARQPRRVDALLGRQNRDVDGPELIWAFLVRFARP
jgi:polyhydroxybutyrate depolymerase